MSNVDEFPLLPPERIAANMLSAQKVYDGLTPAATRLNLELFAALPGIIANLNIHDSVLSIQPVGSRLKGYHRTSSDLDVLVVEHKAYGYNLRHLIDKQLRIKFGVSAVHGMDGYMDPDELLTIYISDDPDQFVEQLKESPRRYASLFGQGGYESSSLHLARAACVAVLQGGKFFDESEAQEAWATIRDSYANYFVSGSSAETIRARIMDFLKGEWPEDPEQIVNEHPYFARYARAPITDAGFPHYVDSSEFFDAYEEDLEAHITDDLLAARARKFGLPSLKRAGVIFDHRIIKPGKNNMFAYILKAATTTRP